MNTDTGYAGEARGEKEFLLKGGVGGWHSDGFEVFPSIKTDSPLLRPTLSSKMNINSYASCATECDVNQQSTKPQHYNGYCWKHPYAIFISRHKSVQPFSTVWS